jgi:hypothetical protein
LAGFTFAGIARAGNGGRCPLRAGPSGRLECMPSHRRPVLCQATARSRRRRSLWRRTWLRAADDRSADHAASPVSASVIGAVEREVSQNAGLGQLEAVRRLGDQARFHDQADGECRRAWQHHGPVRSVIRLGRELLPGGRRNRVAPPRLLAGRQVLAVGEARGAGRADVSIRTGNTHELPQAAGQLRSSILAVEPLPMRGRSLAAHDRKTSHFPPAITAVSVPASHSRAQIWRGM